MYVHPSIITLIIVCVTNDILILVWIHKNNCMYTFLIYKCLN